MQTTLNSNTTTAAMVTANATASSRFRAALRPRAGSATVLRDPVYKAMMAWRFAPLVDRLVDKEGMSPAMATRLIADTKRFLYVCATQSPGGGRLSPPEVIDIGWHHFILFTRDYALFCENHFGRFIHHTPFTRAERQAMVDSRHERGSVQLAQDRAADLFGRLSPNWYATGYSASTGLLIQGCSDCAGSTNCGGNDPPCC